MLYKISCVCVCVCVPYFSCHLSPFVAATLPLKKTKTGGTLFRYVHGHQHIRQEPLLRHQHRQVNIVVQDKQKKDSITSYIYVLAALSFIDT